MFFKPYSHQKEKPNHLSKASHIIAFQIIKVKEKTDLQRGGSTERAKVQNGEHPGWRVERAAQLKISQWCLSNRNWKGAGGGLGGDRRNKSGRWTGAR